MRFAVASCGCPQVIARMRETANRVRLALPVFATVLTLRITLADQWHTTSAKMNAQLLHLKHAELIGLRLGVARDGFERCD